MEASAQTEYEKIAILFTSQAKQNTTLKENNEKKNIFTFT